MSEQMHTYDWTITVTWSTGLEITRNGTYTTPQRKPADDLPTAIFESVTERYPSGGEITSFRVVEK